MKVRQWLYIWCFIGSSFYCAGQGQSLFDNYFTNNYLINPAITGIERFVEFQVLNRSQWSGVDGAPKTLLFSVHAPLGNPLTQPEFTRLTNTNNRAPRYNFPYKGHAGLGFIAYQDKIGPFDNKEVSPSFAYHQPMGRNMQLSMGLGLGFLIRKLDTGFLTLVDDNDPTVNAYNNSVRTLVKAGLLLSTRKWYLGISSSISPSESKFQTLGSLGYRLHKNYWAFSVLPFALLRYNELNQTSADLGFKVDWLDMLFSGAVYRTTKELTAFVGVNAWKNALGVTFSFNTGLGKSTVSNIKNNTLEISILYRLAKQGQFPCFTGVY